MVIGIKLKEDYGLKVVVIKWVCKRGRKVIMWNFWKKILLICNIKYLYCI